jgi:predicted PurR-regulated permease PerM
MAVRALGSSSWRFNLQTWVGLLGLGVAFWLIITHAGLLLEIGLVLFGALLLSVAIRPLVDALARWHLPRSVTVLGVYVGLGGGLALLAILLVPVVSSEVSILQANGPALFREVLSRVSGTPLGHLIPSTDTLAQSLSQNVDVLVRTLVRTATSLGEVVLDVGVVLILTFFFVTDAGLGERLVSGWVPAPHQSRVRVVMAHLRYRLARWMWAQFAVALYFAVIFSVGMTLLGVPFALTIGLVGGVLELVPYLGGAVALVLAVISALTVDPVLVLWVVLFHLVVVEIEAHVVSPAFFGRIMGLHPGIILVALLAGAKAKGILGVLFAVPITVVLMALLQEVRAIQITPDAEAPTPAATEEL